MKSLIVKIDKTIRFLIIVVVCLTPIFTIDEQLYYYGIFSSRDVSSHFIKAMKDIIFLCIYLLFIIKALKSGKLPRIFKFFIPIYGLILLGYFLSPSYFICGLRWSHIFFLCLCLKGCINKPLMRKMQVALNILLVLQVVSQIVEMFIMPPFSGTNFLGLSARCSGFFVHASAGGAFESIVYLMLLLFPIHNRWKKYFIIVLIVISQLICMSSTGIVVLLTLTFFKFLQNKRTSLVVLVFFMILIPLFISNLDTLSGRAKGSVEISGGTRVEIMKDVVETSSLLPIRFGLYTNTAVNMEIPDARILDSSIISILANLGWVGLIYLMVHLGLIGFYAFNRSKKPLSLCLITFVGLSIPIITMELFPINLVFAVLFNYMLHKQNYKRDTIYHLS